MICDAVNRSYARLPVRSARACSPPATSFKILHSGVVDESCHIGASCKEKALGTSCFARVSLASRLLRIAFASRDQYTEPCCY
jgi:hypothetical protein